MTEVTEHKHTLLEEAAGRNGPFSLFSSLCNSKTKMGGGGQEGIGASWQRGEHRVREDFSFI